MSEEWRAIPGYEGRYEVSNSGRVRSIDRSVRTSHGVVRRLPGVDLRPFLNDSGYPIVNLCSGSRSKTRVERVHRLVALAFIGPQPPGCEVAHGDGSRTNNHVSNLRWATRAENVADAVAHGTLGNGGAKLTAEQVVLARKLVADGMPKRSVGRLLGVSYTAIRYIAIGKSWRNVA